MDPLSDVLALLKPRGYVSTALDAGGEWALRFPSNAGIKCYSIVSGHCRLSIEGVDDPITLSAGDSFLLPGGRPFVMASNLLLPSVDSNEVFASPRIKGVISHNGGGNCLMVGSRFFLGQRHAGILLSMLPPVVFIRAKADQAVLLWSVNLMIQELSEQRPGSELTAEHLAHLIMIQALRMHMNEGSKNGGMGWLYALADPKLAAALNAMHSTPAHRWTLAELANYAGMSRSAFALNFKKVVGTTTMEYLTQWRMMLAGEKLLNSGLPISAIAPSLGYESESAFSTAFKRVIGCSPRDYTRRHRLSD